jgi:hypothetical protein
MVGNAIPAHTEEGTDELCSLPGVQAGLHEFLAQGREIGQGEFLDRGKLR